MRRTRPFASIACSTSSRSRRMRDDSLDANTASAAAPSSVSPSTSVNSRSNARLRCASTALVVSSTTTAPSTESPAHTGCAAATMPTRPSRDVRRSTVRMPASARSTSRANGSGRPRKSSLKSSVGCASRSAYSGRTALRSSHAAARAKPCGGGASAASGRFSVPTRAMTLDWRSTTKMRAVVLDRPCRIASISAVPAASPAAAPRRRHRRPREERRAIVQGGRHRLGRAGERALLRLAQHALDLLHVGVAEPGNGQENGEDQQELRADAEPEARPRHQLPPSASQR